MNTTTLGVSSSAVGERRRDPISKLRHLDACLSYPVEYSRTTGLEAFHFESNAVPELCLTRVDLSTSLAGTMLRAPFMIAPMTGGTRRGHEINQRLAAAAETFGIAMSVGSQRVALEDAEVAGRFEVRSVAPNAMIFANFGAAQLGRGWGASEALRAVEMIEANALFIHFNPIQEAIQGGDRDFTEIARGLSGLCHRMSALGVPVFAREVCFGLSVDAVRRLMDCGVSGLDCAGVGGTSWAKVEAYCASTPQRRERGLRFGEWGIPTSRSLLNVREVSQSIPLIASGGLRTGLDLAKVLALGADVGAMARPLLVKAVEGELALHAFIEEVLTDLRISMFGVGAGSIAALRGTLKKAGAAA